MTGQDTKINVIIGGILSLIFVFFSFLGISFLEKFNCRLYDLVSPFVHSDNLNPDKVVIIEIDEKSLDNIGSWPWQRRVLAEMVDVLKENEVRLIGLNIPLDEMANNEGVEEIKLFRERYDAYPAASNDISLKKWVLANLDEIEKKIDSDSRLINSINDAGNVILPVFGGPQTNTKNNITTDDSFLLKNALNSSNISSSIKKRMGVDKLISPASEYGNNAAGIGIIDKTVMADALRRSYPTYYNYKGILLPSFALRIATSYFGMRPEELTIKDNMLLLKERSISLAKGEMFINSGEEKRRYSFVDILNAKDFKGNLKGKIILIGFNDYNSRIPGMPGVKTETQLNAQLLDNIINSGTISRPPIMPYIETILVLLMGISVSFISYIKGVTLRPVLVSGAFLFIISGSLLMLIATGIWLQVAYGTGCLVFVYVVLMLKEFFKTEVFLRNTPEETRMLGISYQDKGLLDQAFGKYKRLPPDNESKGIIYNLGLEYESKYKPDKALKVYEHIAWMGGYKDVEERIARLKRSENSILLSGLGEVKGTDKVSDSRERVRSRVGRYEILEVMGKGSMGLVYKARDPKINRTVAIKTIRFSDEFEDDVIQEIKERFFREAEIAGRLSHPSIVTIHDVGDDGDLTYMAMEFLEGEDLDNFIKKGSLLSLRRVLDVITRTAEALDYAHKENVIHRDIKPANIMLLKNGNIKVTDFGIAKAISTSRTKTGIILGTPNYMSPEQIMGQKIDSRSDIFSLGVLFYQLITGELPFHGDNLSGLLYQITQIKHPSPRSYNPKIPNICEQILDKAMAKAPAKRFRSAGEMARVLNSLGQRIDQIRVAKSSTSIKGSD